MNGTFIQPDKQNPPCFAPPTTGNLIWRMLTLPSRVDRWQGIRRDTVHSTSSNYFINPTSIASAKVRQPIISNPCGASVIRRLAERGIKLGKIEP
ncbi:MAG: hypothetical protein GY943_08445 [Chloroflexi bacterium]|nr:hypothetical protein [Chloroflexota bacterium]